MTSPISCMKKLLLLMPLLLFGCQADRQSEGNPLTDSGSISLEQRLQWIRGDDGRVRADMIKIDTENRDIDTSSRTPGEKLQEKEKLYDIVSTCEPYITCDEFFLEIMRKAAGAVIGLKQDGHRHAPSAAYYCREPEKDMRCSMIFSDDTLIAEEAVNNPPFILDPAHPIRLAIDPSFHPTEPITLYMTTYDPAGIMRFTPVPIAKDGTLDLSTLPTQTFPVLFALIKGEGDTFMKKVSWSMFP